MFLRYLLASIASACPAQPGTRGEVVAARLALDSAYRFDIPGDKVYNPMQDDCKAAGGWIEVQSQSRVAACLLPIARAQMAVLGSKYPKHELVYEVNYGFVPDTMAPDGEFLDAYILGEADSLSQFVGECIAVIHRLNDNEDNGRALTTMTSK